MNKPELIIFDLGRVLVDFDFWLVIRRLTRFTKLTEKDIRRYFLQTPLWGAFERGEVGPKDFYTRVSNDLKLRDLSFKEFGPLWNTIFTEKPDSVSILARLKGRYRVALLSNVNILHWEHVRARHDFIRWFDHPITSFEVGHRKPDPDIYLAALRTAGVLPSTAIFIDDMESHVLGARSLGIRAHRFTSAQQLTRDLDGIVP